MYVLIEINICAKCNKLLVSVTNVTLLLRHGDTTVTNVILLLWHGDTAVTHVILLLWHGDTAVTHVILLRTLAWRHNSDKCDLTSLAW